MGICCAAAAAEGETRGDLGETRGGPGETRTTLLSGRRWVNTRYSRQVFPRRGQNTRVLPTQRAQVRA